MGILLIIANLYIDYNLRKYSVYYAHNMEDMKGTHPAGNGIRKYGGYLISLTRRIYGIGMVAVMLFAKIFLDSEQFSISYNRGERVLWWLL